MKALRIIFQNIPTLIKWLIVSGCLAPILGFCIVQYVTQQTISFSLKKVFVILVILLALLILGFIVGSLRSLIVLLHEKEKNFFGLQNAAPKKKVLPYSRISLVTFSSEDLSVDIQAKILLGEIVEPGVDIFLQRVEIGHPFCPKCNTPLDIKRASWMADGVQTGYLCKKCATEDNRDSSELLSDVKGYVRSNFNDMWSLYKKKLADLTDNRQEEYCLPS